MAESLSLSAHVQDVILIVSMLSVASTLVSACYIIMPPQKNTGMFGRRVNHNPSNELLTAPANSHNLPNRIRFARNSIFLKRRRRTVARGHHRRYPYGIVPFTFDPTLTSWQKAVINQTMSIFENYTCIRFVNNILDNGQMAKNVYRLGHNGYIEFINNATCFSSAVGNSRTKTRISCCRQRDCLRLVGKALGQRIEHKSYRRNGFLRINPNSIPPGRRARYIKPQQWQVVDQYPIDLSSPMNEAYDINGSTPITLLTPDIGQHTGLFYFFQEISATHDCAANNCSQLQHKCTNDGYVTLVKGQCACRCPDGLDPVTYCSTVVSVPNDAEKCGNVFSLSEEDPSISFASHAKRNSTCTWLVNAPEGYTIIMDFNEFDIAMSYGECEDWVEIRHSRIGNRGNDHCGKESPKSVTSYFNHVLLRLFTSVRNKFHSSFTVTARLISKQNLCYNPADKGYTYSGTVDYARDYSPCVPWWQMTHCQHHPYKFEDMNARLDNNYCRNPGNGLKPWCYVNPRGCQRKYCDVCMMEKPYNVLKDCYHLVNSTQYCTKDKQLARSTCAKECQHELFRPQAGIAKVTCNRPSIPTDGIQLNKRNKSRFDVGEFVNFRCRHVHRLYRTTVKKYCLSSGQWSDANLACLPCHLNKGWIMHGESCYGVSIGKRSADDHQLRCRRNGGDLIDIVSWEEQKFVSQLVFSKGVRKYFIGATDIFQENRFYFRNFDSVSWTNWSPDSINGKGIDCVVVDIEGVWTHEQCHRKFQAVCKAPILRHRKPAGNSCIDFREDCQKMADLDVKMCERDDGMFAVTQCAKTCGVC